LLAVKMVGSDPIHKATIIPRGRALGMVMRLPERDSVSLTRQKCFADMKVATGLARAMATEFGMSDKLGPLLYGDNQDEMFLGRSMMQRSIHLSDETQQLVDAEVKRFVEEGYDMAKKVILENIDDLHRIAGALLEYETLTG